MHLQTRSGKFRENTKIHLSFGEQLFGFGLWFRYNLRLFFLCVCCRELRCKYAYFILDY